MSGQLSEVVGNGQPKGAEAAMAEREPLAAENRIDLGDLIDKANRLIHWAEERRRQVAALHAVLRQLEEQVKLAIKDDDQEGATWLRSAIEALKEEARVRLGSLPTATRATPQVSDEVKAPTPSPPETRRETSTVVPLPPVGPLPNHTRLSDLAQWHQRWQVVAQELLEGTASRTDHDWLLKARAVLCGLLALRQRYAGEAAYGSDIAEAHRLACAVQEQLKAAGREWMLPNKWSVTGDRTRDAHILRQVSDAYSRAALASRIVHEERDNPSESEDWRRHRLSAALATLEYLARLLAESSLSDGLVDEELAVARQVGGAVGAKGLDASHLTDIPPYRSEVLSRLLEPRVSEEEVAPPPPDPREVAVSRILELVQSRPDFGADPARLEVDRNAVVPLLRAAFGAGVPPSHKQIRDSILDRWPALLEGVEGFQVFLREVSAELERREAEEGDEERAASDGNGTEAHYAEALRPLVEGKRLLILGGVPRVHTGPRLQKALGLSEVAWPEAKRTDEASKFEADMRRSDLILVIKNFSRHAACELAKKVAGEKSIPCIVLTAGYGVTRILAEMYGYFQQRGQIPAV